MTGRCMIGALFALAAGLGLARADDPPRTDDKGTYMGVLFSRIPEKQAKKLPEGHRDHGVAVTQVIPGSPAAKVDLRRGDALLKYNDTSIRDCEHFAHLIQNSKPGDKVKLRVLRGDQDLTVEVTLTVGPKLTIANPRGAGADKSEVPRAVAKPAGPMPVSVAVAPLEDGKMKVIVEYQ